MEEAFLEFFSLHKRIFLTFHLIGVIVGMGGATITDILFFNFLRDFTIAKKEAEVMHILSNVIMGMLVLIYLSGIALFFSDPETFKASAPFLAKAFIVVVLSINGVLMHKFVAPHMVKFSFLRHPIESRNTLHRMRATAFAMGAVSFTSWYAVFFIAMLKSYLPADVGVSSILVVYALILFGAICGSQVMHRHIHRKSLL